MLQAGSVPVLAQEAQPPTPAGNQTYQGRQFIRSDRLGITFISSAQLEPDDDRYRNALLLGAGWTRWPLYWNAIETAQGTFNWSAYDRLIIDDMRHGLRINAILLDRPAFYADGGIIAGLNTPIYADGTDTPGAGKELNPQNPWALFVYQAVQRYKPGGVLARQQGWINGEGVSIWEVWNEPDLPQFWQGGIGNYARLLKVAYLAAHQADPAATVMFGGLLFNTPDNWLARVLAIFEQDPQREQHNWYMDAVALHSYNYPWRTGWLTLYVRETLNAYRLRKPIFVNESGLNVWNDYPGPTWTTTSEERLKLGTAEQQAWFFIQSTAYAYAEGAEVVFFHQLYDDCGDQAPGTNFPPHNGELCGAGSCFGDAWGLFRNKANALCYSQHPNPGTPRPAATAFRLLAQVFGSEPFTNGDVTRQNGLTIISFDRPNTQERIRVVWNRRFESNTATLPAEGSGATLYTLLTVNTISPADGAYRIELKPAQPDNFPGLEDGDISAVGGEPVILVEKVSGSLATPISATVEVQPQQATVTSVPPTPGPVVVPTTAPELDVVPPTTSVEPLPDVSDTTFTVRWSGNDNGQIDRYVVWIRVDEGEWTPWLETQRTEGVYTGESGRTYAFAVWAVDVAGNWSANSDLQPQAQTRVN
jgi:hypothetical protein